MITLLNYSTGLYWKLCIVTCLMWRTRVSTPSGDGGGDSGSGGTYVCVGGGAALKYHGLCRQFSNGTHYSCAFCREKG